MLSLAQLTLLKELAVKNKESKYKALQEILLQKEEHYKMLNDIKKQLDSPLAKYVSGQVFRKQDFELQQFNRNKLEHTLHQLETYTLTINERFRQKQTELNGALVHVKKWDILIDKAHERIAKKSSRLEQYATDEFNTIRRGRSVWLNDTSS